MPTYDFLNKDTGEYFRESMRIAELDEFLNANPHIEQAFLAVGIVSSSGKNKPDQGFRDILREAKKHYDKVDKYSKTLTGTQTKHRIETFD